MSSILGPAPIVDFDGTLALLVVPWQALRSELQVSRVEDLWRTENQGAWDAVTAAEIQAAAAAEPVSALIEALETVRSFAVLTANSELAVTAFCGRFGELGERLGVVVGRETLVGPKRDFGVFRLGFEACVASTSVERGSAPIVYVGDDGYELEFARRLGANAVHVGDLDR